MDLKQQLQQTLGASYVLDRELGGGGMSRVFVADERRLNRKVVIKVLSPELAAGVSAERFEREIQLAASLQQANIVPILAAGETEGLPFYTMPFVDGESLRAHLSKSGPLPIGTVINILRDVSKALAYAHERHVVHRDIKPDNVLLSGGTAVVTDFGIAKAIANARDERLEAEGGSLTQLGTSVGTPAYMSPEQAAGDPNVDHRADIYSLGCMAYELLTGNTPFHGRAAARMLAAHMTEAPKPIAELRPDTPTSLQQIVMRCLEKEPAQRPQSGQEIVDQLESVSSTSLSSVPMTSAGALRRNLLLYAAAVAAVAIVARAAIVVFGLPDWVFIGAVVVMLLGLPVIITTGIAAHRHLTWRRAWVAGGAALAGFALLVAGFMVLRALGIGPAGSLLAAGKLSDRERVIVTEFQTPDTSLSTLVTEAVRTNLGQSRVISILPASAIGASLQRMQRPATSRVDLKLAQEIAQREGVKAIVDGRVQTLGADYIVSMRLVSADSANVLAAFQETANGSRELLEKIDELTRKLRGKIGESLRDVRGSPPLEQVTTPSLEALRIYAQAARFIDMGGSPIEGAERLREAVRIDTQFAMAYRKLGVALSNSGMPRIRVDSALERAFRFRDRLTERERLLAEGTYYQLGPGRDRGRAIRAYEALLAIDPNESGAANNLASILSGRREFARAESLFKRMIASGRATSQQYTNLISVLYNGGKVEEAEKLSAEYRQRFPQSSIGHVAPVTFLYQREQFDSMQTVLRELERSPDPILKVNGVGGLASYSLLRGRVDEALRYGKQAQAIARQLGGQPPQPINDSLSRSFLDVSYYDDTSRAVRRMEAVLAKGDWKQVPFDFRPYSGLVSFFAAAGQPQRARALLTQYQAEMPDSTVRRIRQPEIHGMQGAIAIAEKRYEDAIREIWKADTTYDGPDGNCAVCVWDDVGWAWNYAGVADSAIYYWEKYLGTPYFGRQGMDAAQRAIIVKRLGELYDAKGDVANAAKRYREFLKLWENADPRLQPKVNEVRRKLSRLADVERKS